MIFLTVGTQLPFDRLVTIINDFSKANPDIDIIGQIGDSQLTNLNFKCFENLSIAEFNEYFDNAEAVISHAGMGTILTSLTAGKPLFMMPRLLRYNEHRNDHQLGTIEKFKDKPFCYGFDDLHSFTQSFQQYRSNQEKSNIDVLSQFAPDAMVLKLNNLIHKLMVNR
jgi:UDP-N-acetylglucosamine transferase subunit ALG13